MSPEQASGGELDGRSDLFSVGVMLYVMITRRHPFDAPTDYETLMLVKNGDFMPPETARPGLNPELYRAIRKAMGKTPADRYQKAEDMLIDVEQVMRLAFRPVGQTELQRWLADLGSKDGVPTLTREAPPEPPTSRSTVGPLRAGDGQESGLVLTLDDAEEVRQSDRPPPHPAATEVMLKPPQFQAVDRPWHRRPPVRIGAAIAVLLLAAVVSARVLSGRHRPQPSAATATAPAPGAAVPPSPPSAQVPPPVAENAAHPAIVLDAQGTAPGGAGAHEATAAPRDGGAPPQVAVAGSVHRTSPASDETAPGTSNGTSKDAPAAGDSGQDRSSSRAHGTSKPKPPQFPVSIKSDPPGTRVATGRQGFGTTPLTLKLRPGNSYDLTFTKAGYAPLLRRYRFEGYGPQTLRVSLKKMPETRKPVPPPATAAKPTSPAKSGFFSR
jgi:hypothetical protein